VPNDRRTMDHSIAPQQLRTSCREFHQNTREPESSAGTKRALHTAHGWLRGDAKCLMEIVTSFMPNGTAMTLAMLSPIAQTESSQPVAFAPIHSR
jgi:hypothetical protein